MKPAYKFLLASVAIFIFTITLLWLTSADSDAINSCIATSNYNYEQCELLLNM